MPESLTFFEETAQLLQNLHKKQRDIHVWRQRAFIIGGVLAFVPFLVFAAPLDFLVLAAMSLLSPIVTPPVAAFFWFILQSAINLAVFSAFTYVGYKFIKFILNIDDDKQKYGNTNKTIQNYLEEIQTSVQTSLSNVNGNTLDQIQKALEGAELQCKYGAILPALENPVRAFFFFAAHATNSENANNGVENLLTLADRLLKLKSMSPEVYKFANPKQMLAIYKTARETAYRSPDLFRRIFPLNGSIGNKAQRLEALSGYLLYDAITKVEKLLDNPNALFRGIRLSINLHIIELEKRSINSPLLNAHLADLNTKLATEGKYIHFSGNVTKQIVPKPEPSADNGLNHSQSPLSIASANDGRLSVSVINAAKIAQAQNDNVSNIVSDSSQKVDEYTPIIRNGNET